MGLIFVFDIYFSENIKIFKGNFWGIFCDPMWSNKIFTLKHVDK